jgi:putative heme-binding domain-containing protein
MNCGCFGTLSYPTSRCLLDATPQSIVDVHLPPTTIQIMRFFSLGVGIAFLVPISFLPLHPTLGSDDQSVEQSVGPGANEPNSPAGWYGEGVRPSEKRSPQEELEGFHVPPGFVVELVASEPDIAKPLNMAFDSVGKLWITQTVEYPYPTKAGEVSRDCVKTLEDTDQDGDFDKITTFADGLNIPMGILPYQDGVIVFTIPNLMHLRDLDGDGVCDHREVILGPFDTTRDTHGMVNSLRRGDDGWIYACHGFSNQSIVKGRDGHEVRLTSGNTFRFRPDGSRIEHYTSGQVNPFGMTVDRYGNRITADCHSKPLTSLFPGASYPSFGRPDDGLGFFPAMMDHLHGSTAISGVSLYDANSFPTEYRDQIYSGNVMTSRINRDRVARRGATMIATEIQDFLTSDDPWFRPVDIQLGPDGALYVADFYNRIIGHYEVPLEHPGRDRDSGRIWRIRHQDSPRIDLRVGTHELHLESLFGELGHHNATRRQLALDALTDIGLKNEASAASLVEIAGSRLRSADELAKVGCLWLLHRLEQLAQTQLLAVLQDAAPLLRAHTLRAVFESPSISDKNVDAALISEARRSVNDDSAEVGSWAAKVLSRLGEASDCELLARTIASQSEDDPMLRARLRLALRDLVRRYPRVLHELASQALLASEKQVYRDVMLGIHTSDVVLPILIDLEAAESLKTKLPWIRHAAKCGDESQFAQLIKTLRARCEDRERITDISPRELFQELQAVTTGRSSPALKVWVDSFVKQSLDAIQRAASHGQLPIAWTADGATAWGLESRQANDQQNAFRYRSSLTRGETYTGVIRSAPFTADAMLSFWIVGHNGYPANEDRQLNRVQLIDAKTSEVLQQAFPPRSDIAQQITWDLRAWQGKQVRVEVIDGDSGAAYAWIGVGRFDRESLNPSAIEDEWNAALSLIAEYKCESALPQLETLVANPSIDSRMRLQALQQRSEVTGYAATAAALSIILSYNADPTLQAQCLQIALNEQDVDKQKVAYRGVVQALAVASPQRVQLEIARQLAANRELTPWLIEAWEEGWLAPELSQDKNVETTLESTLTNELKDRFQAIKQTVAPVREAVVNFAQAVLQSATDTVGDLKKGEIVFQKQCANCHQLGGVGALVGPQLDGVGVRSRERLLEDILFPDRNVDKAFRTTSLLLVDGSVRVGLIRSETPDSIEIVDNAGKVSRIDATDVDSRRAGGRSLMPDGHHETLGVTGIIDLLTFLQENASQRPER